MTPKVDAKDVIRGWNNGRCQITGAYQPGASDFSHRTASGRGGPRTTSNGLFLWRVTHSIITGEQGLSRRAGWMVKTNIPPATVPALCICDDIQGWFWLDRDGDGRTEHATAGEVAAAGLDPTLTLRCALIELAQLTGWRAPGWDLPVRESEPVS